MNNRKLELHLGRIAFHGSNVTAACGAHFGECASVCLENQNHQSGVLMGVDGVAPCSLTLHWEPVTDQQFKCYADLQWATENGAYAIAFHLVSELAGKKVIERSRKGTGFDYWVGASDDDDLIFHSKARLEVSGILSGSDRDILARVKQKLKQTTQSDDLGLTAYVAIVEFGQPKARLETR